MQVFPNIRRVFCTLCAFATVSACATAPLPTGINDPNEVKNRKVHALNSRVNPPKASYRDPSDLQKVMGNVSHNLSMPGVAVNSLLQGDLRGMTLSTYRFVINSTLGIGGIGDVASDFGTPTHDTDFGETLHVWGVREGKYVVLPILGPSTQRDATGKVVDLFTNPLGYTLESPESHVGKVTGFLSRRGVKPRYSPDIAPTNDTVTDPYIRARDAYLRKRRAELVD